MQKAEIETKKKRKEMSWKKAILIETDPSIRWSWHTHTHTHNGYGGSALQINQKSISNNLFYWNNKNKTK